MPVVDTRADVRRDAARWAAVSAAATFLLALWGPPAAGGPMPPAAFLDSSIALALLAAAAFVDARTREVPDAIPAGIVAAHVATCPALPGFPASLAVAVAGGLALGGGLLAFTLAYEQATGAFGMGGGDIKLVAALGFSLGAGRAAAALLCACAVFAALHLAQAAFAWRRGGRMPDAAPFCPSLAAGALAAMLLA